MSVTTPPRGAPRAAPAAAPLAVVLGLALVALAVVAVRDLVVSQGWAGGTPWSTSLVRSLDGLSASNATVVVAVLVGVVGLVLVVLALKPARKTHLRGPGDADLWISAAAVAALARGIADRVPGVISATTSRVGARRVRIDVVTAQDAGEVRTRVDEAIRSRLEGLTATTITVRMKEVSR